MQLTEENYFTPENNFLTSSKVKDYIKSPEYFFEKHILGIVEQKRSDALLEGKMLDTLLTKGQDVFEFLFRVVERRSLKNPPTDHTEVTQTMYNACLQRAAKLRATTAFRDLTTHKTQVILQKELPNLGKRFVGIAGMLDFLHLDVVNNLAIITDLKTSVTVDPTKYYWHSINYGYDIQMAWYGWLIHEVHGIDYHNIQYRHLVIEKDPDGIGKVGTFTFNNDFIDLKREMLQSLVVEIGNRETFKNKDVTWDNATILKPFSNGSGTLLDDEDLDTLPS